MISRRDRAVGPRPQFTPTFLLQIVTKRARRLRGLRIGLEAIGISERMQRFGGEAR